MMRASEIPVIPSFFLYGEPPRDAGDRFLHLEDLDDRSRPSDWNIRPHAHRNLHQIFFLLTGGGEMRTDQDVAQFTAPALLLVPAGIIHAFIWETGSTGQVLTLSDTYGQELWLREPGLATIFSGPARLEIAAGGVEAAALAQSLLRLARELTWEAPYHDAAVEAHLIAFFIEVLRVALRTREAGAAAPGRQAELLARFRQLIENEFRNALKLETYARRLNVTVSQLRAACLKIARKSPTQLIQDRIALEAKRLLIYSNMTVAEVGYSLGFEDPAYFSRFFRKVTARSPRHFRDSV